MTDAGLNNQPLRDMVAVGAIGPRSVRLWARSPGPWPLRVRWSAGDLEATGEVPRGVDDAAAQDHTGAFRIPEDVAQAAPLRPLTRYRYRVEAADGRLVGEGTFHTAPERAEDTPERFSIGLLSCHQPFDGQGQVRPEAEAMLRAGHRCLSEHDARLLLTVGDQMYSDAPAGFSLFQAEHFARVAPPGRERLLDCSVEEVRALYQARYRHFWAPAAWRSLLAEFPCYPILDDHELVDNWGSDPVHQREDWARVGQGARAAYFDYQGSRVLPRPPQDALPPDFHYEIDYGHLAVFVLDLRSHRRAGANGQLFGATQARELEAFFERHQAKRLVFVVCSVPVVHLPRWAATVVARITPDGEDFSDRWSSGAHLADRDLFLRLVHEHQLRVPEQRVVLLSGDIHVGCAHELAWRDGPRLFQFVSSAITNQPGVLVEIAAKLSIGFTRGIRSVDGARAARAHFLPGERGHDRNPYGGLNLGLVEVETPRSGAPPRVRFLLYGHEGERPLCVYRSPWIEPR